MKRGGGGGLASVMLQTDLNVSSEFLGTRGNQKDEQEVTVLLPLFLSLCLPSTNIPLFDLEPIQKIWSRRT